MPASMTPMAMPISASLLDPPPCTSMKKLRRMPRSPAMKLENVESLPEYESMPSISLGFIPASRMALPTAQLPSARVVRPEVCV